MELSLTELSIITGIAVAFVTVWTKLTPIIRWRATVDAKIERLEEGKDKLFEKLEAIAQKIDDKVDKLDARLDKHEQGCAEWRGEVKTKLDVLLTRTEQ